MPQSNGPKKKSATPSRPAHNKSGSSQHAMSKRASTSVQVEELAIESIVEGDRTRRIVTKDVARLAKAIELAGLKTPIDVVRIKKGMLQGRYKLIAGAHRLAAYELLGKATIPAKVLNAEQAKGLEEIENLYRSSLRALDESEAIVREVKKFELFDNAKPRGGRQPHDKGYSRAEEVTGFTRKRIADAFLHHQMPSRIKERLKTLGLDDNLKQISAISKLATETDQKRALDRLGGNSTRKPKPSPRDVAEKLSALQAKWKKSLFKKIYDQECVEVQRGFVRSLRH